MLYKLCVIKTINNSVLKNNNDISDFPVLTNRMKG